MKSTLLYSALGAVVLAFPGVAQAAVTLQIISDNDFAVFVGTSTTVTRLIYVGSSRVDLQACKLEYSIVSPK